MQIMQDYYKVLGVTPDASLCQIKEAYRTLAFRYHPDRNQNNIEANQKIMEINVANDTLSDPVKRKQYDVPKGYHISVSKFKVGEQSNNQLPFSFALQRPDRGGRYITF